MPEDITRIPAYPFRADFRLKFDPDNRVNVISQRCQVAEGPRAIAVLLPGVHGGVGPCREPGRDYDANCLYAMVAKRLLAMNAPVDVYRCSWPFMRPDMHFSLGAVCRVLRHGLKQVDSSKTPTVRVVVVGHSLGGAVALHAASLLSQFHADGRRLTGAPAPEARITGFCTLNGACDVRHSEGRSDVLKNLRGLKALLVSGDADEVVPPQYTAELYKALRGKDKRHLSLPNGAHDLYSHKETLIEEVSNFIISCSKD